jgi:hypothetical protein
VVRQASLNWEEVDVEKPWDEVVGFGKPGKGTWMVL